MSVAVKVKEFIESCPFLDEFKQMFPVVRMELLDEDATAYSIESTPAEPILKRYTNGDTVRSTCFLCVPGNCTVKRKTRKQLNFMRNLRTGWMNARRTKSCRHCPDSCRAGRFARRLAVIFMITPERSASIGYNVNLFISKNGG